MAQSLGPLTALLCHIRTDEKYRRKWTDAAKRAMAHIPIIDEILDIVKGKSASEVRGIVGLLADILLITTSRQANRMFFPLAIIAKIYGLPLGDNDYILTSDKIPTAYVGGDTWLKAFNVSGNGGFYTYKLATMFRWELEGEFTHDEAQQVLFHTIFGTYKEDLCI